MKFILSIDGGGLRGIIPAMILSQIQKITSKRSCQLFDLYIGSSTGAMISLMINTPNGTGTSKYSAQQIKQIYKYQGNQIFKTNVIRKITTGFGLIQNKYSNKGLMNVLSQHFGNTKLKDMINNVVVPSYDIENCESFFIKSWRQEHKEIKALEASMASSAAPTYFSPIKLMGKSLIDGGVFINNPSVSGYAQACRLYPNEQIFILSLGTGVDDKHYDYKKLKNGGVIRWLDPVLYSVFDGVSQAADYQMQHILQNNYKRISIDTHKYIPMDDCAYIGQIQQLGFKIIESNKQQIDYVSNLLMNNFNAR